MDGLSANYEMLEDPAGEFLVLFKIPGLKYFAGVQPNPTWIDVSLTDSFNPKLTPLAPEEVEIYSKFLEDFEKVLEEYKIDSQSSGIR